MGRSYKWSDEEIWRWGALYVEGKIALMKLEESLCVSHSTLWWCFEHRLADTDKDLYNAVQNKLRANRRY